MQVMGANRWRFALPGGGWGGLAVVTLYTDIRPCPRHCDLSTLTLAGPMVGDRCPI